MASFFNIRLAILLALRNRHADKVEAAGRDTNGTMNVSAVTKRSILTLSLDPQCRLSEQFAKCADRQLVPPIFWRDWRGSRGWD